MSKLRWNCGVLEYFNEGTGYWTEVPHVEDMTSGRAEELPHMCTQAQREFGDESGSHMSSIPAGQSKG